MNKSQTEKEIKHVHERFEAFAGREISDIDLTRCENSPFGYADVGTQLLFFMFNAGYHNQKSTILTFGDPDLSRLYGMKHPNTSWWDEK